MNANFIRRGWPLIALLPLGSHAASSSAQEDTVVVTQSDRATADTDSSYQPHKSVAGTRTEARLLDVPQAVTVVTDKVMVVSFGNKAIDHAVINSVA